MREQRLDIQGLRALAVVAVVLFHFWPWLLGGGFVGVDVFFVISGFLITSHLLRDLVTSDFSVTKFWAKRIRRLIPASFLVLAVTAIVTWALVDSADQAIWFAEISASAGYFENWLLSINAVDYLALSNAASPVQHFWSLSAEEQFYFVWPLLIFLASVIAAKRNGNAKRLSLLILLLLSVASLTYSIVLTNLLPALAYFNTGTRLWEFGVGALIAFAPRNKLGPYTSSLFFNISVFAIVAAALLIKPSDAFPGLLAIWPTLATAAAIWFEPKRGLVLRWLSAKTAQFIGEISYSIYLWHWPILILTPFVISATPNLLVQLLMIALTVLLAWQTRKRIELPFIEHKIRIKPTFLAMIASAAVLITASSIGTIAAQAQIREGLAMTEKIGSTLPKCVGAKARMPDGSLCSNAEYKGLLLPSPDLAAADDMVSAYPNCPGLNAAGTEVRACHLGSRNSAVRIALVGDSHANQYAGALDLIGKRHGYAVDVMAKGGCPLTYAKRVQDQILTKACVEWVRNTVRYLSSHRYQVIITTMKSGVTWQNGGSGVAGTKQLLQALEATGASVIYIKDNPQPITDVLQCLRFSKSRENEACSVSRKDAVKLQPAVRAIKQLASSRITLLNLDRVFCDSDTCQPVIGNIVVYRDDNHLTDTFAKTLAPNISAAIAEVLRSKG